MISPQKLKIFETLDGKSTKMSIPPTFPSQI